MKTLRTDRNSTPLPLAVGSLFLAAFTFASCGGGGDDPPPTTPAESVEQGKSNAQAGNFQSAKESLEAALANPATTAQQAAEAGFYLAFVDLALIVDQEGTSPAAAALHDLLARFGFPAGGPDLVNLEAFTPPADLPASSPTCDEILAYISMHMLPALAAAESRLAGLTDFVSLLAINGTSEVIEIDGTDVLAARAFLRALRVPLHFLAAYGCNLDLDALASLMDQPQPNRDFLDADMQLLSLVSMADLAESRLAAQAAIGLYDQGLASLQAEIDDQSDDLIIFATPTSEMEALELQADLQEALATTNGPRTLDLGQGRMLTVNLGVPSFTTLDIRNQLPFLEDFREFPAIWTMAFDPTINGILPGLSANQFPGLLVPFDAAPTVANGAISLTDGTTDDWVNAGVDIAATDPSGVEDLDADLDPGGVAVDVAGIFICQDLDSYFFRVDFDGGMPMSGLNSYEFDLQGNDQTAGEPDFFGSIRRSFFMGTELELSVFGPQGTVIPSDAGLLQAGDGFLEFELPKAPFVTPGGVTDGAQYVFSFSSDYFEFPSFDEASDEGRPIRLLLDLQ